jgi:hypothetical protein
MKRTIVIIVVLIMITVPYINAVVSTDSNSVFGGFLLNPKDGNSYLAKMEEGYQGDWLFTLPFTPEKGDGQPLFLFYIFLGHLARWLHISSIIMFHFIRVAAAGFLLWTIWKFATCLFPGEPSKADLFFTLAALGSGMGWVLFAFGIPTSDLWVAEAYPFLSMYVNPHFPLGLGLMLWIFMITNDQAKRAKRLGIIPIGLVLSVVLPFGVVIVAIVLGIHWIWNCFSKATFNIPLEVLALLPGIAWVVIQYWVTIKDPMLAVWNIQNVTPAPLIWDWIISFSPVLILFFFAVNKEKTEESTAIWRVMLIWAATATIIQVIPFSLQRRFLLGFYFPLAAYAVQAIFLVRKKTRRLLVPVVLSISIATNLIVLVLGFYAVKTQAPELFFPFSDNLAYAWIRENTPLDSVILCSPETGGRIPGRTGRRVVYGHEYETVNAITSLNGVQTYWADPMSDQSEQWAVKNQVDYVFLGQQEKTLLGEKIINPGKVVYENSEVTIYQFSSP